MDGSGEGVMFILSYFGKCKYVGSGDVEALLHSDERHEKRVKEKAAPAFLRQDNHVNTDKVMVVL